MRYFRPLCSTLQYGWKIAELFTIYSYLECLKKKPVCVKIKWNRFMQSFVGMVLSYVAILVYLAFSRTSV